MQVTITGKYVGKKFVEATHQPSGAQITTDAPKDNQGEGNCFSPTDLVAAALGNCILTIMANVCERCDEPVVKNPRSTIHESNN